MRKIILVAACCCVYSLCYGEQPAGIIPAEGVVAAVPPQLAVPVAEEKKCDYLENVFGTAESCNNMTYHQLNYSILGDDDAKMQMSFKYRLFDKKKVYLAATVRLFWGLYQPSNPLTDVDFNPELFYRFDGNKEWLLSMDAGYNHISNGRDEHASRAWDRLMFRVNARPVSSPFDLLWTTTFLLSVKKGMDNPDIADYTGFWESKLLAHQLLGRSGENLDLEFKLIAGRGGIPFDKGAYQFGAKYKIPGSFNPYLYAEYFNGYDEAMLNYKNRSDQFRGGLAFYY